MFDTFWLYKKSLWSWHDVILAWLLKEKAEILLTSISEALWTYMKHIWAKCHQSQKVPKRRSRLEWCPFYLQSFLRFGRCSSCKNIFGCQWSVWVCPEVSDGPNIAMSVKIMILHSSLFSYSYHIPILCVCQSLENKVQFSEVQVYIYIYIYTIYIYTQYIYIYNIYTQYIYIYMVICICLYVYMYIMHEPSRDHD